MVKITIGYMNSSYSKDPKDREITPSIQEAILPSGVQEISILSIRFFLDVSSAWAKKEC